MFLIYVKRFLFLAAFGLLILAQTATAQRIVSGELSSDEPNAPQISAAKPSAVTALASNDGDKADDSNTNLPLTGKEVSAADFRAEIKDIKYHFRQIEANARNLDFDAAGDNSGKAANQPDEPRYVRETAPGRGFNYGGAFKQSLLFLSVQHGYAILGQAKTRRALKHGPFFQDYLDSVKSLHGWDDGGRFFTNYIAHPMQGALTGHIYVQNSPQALREQFSMSGKYWSTRMKAFLWTAAWSTQFELGPVSQASIGNVGLKGKQTYEDIVVTPIAGTMMLVAEDAIDRYFVKGIERGNNNFYVKVFARMLLNPTRNFSNLLRFKEPWYRDRPDAR